MTVTRRGCAGPAIIVTTLLLIPAFAALFFIWVPYFIQERVKMETQLVKGSKTWNKWSNISVPIFIKYHFFNVTNPEAVVKNGAKFELQEVGPYVWQEKRKKEILAVDEEEDTVTFRESVRFYYRPDLSVGSLDDVINIANLPFISASTKVYMKLLSFIANPLVENFIAHNETVVATGVKVRQLVFEGVPLKEPYKELADIAGLFKEPSPDVKAGVFAFGYNKNGTPSKEYKIYRGVKNFEDFGKIVTYDNKKSMSIWSGECNKIRGTDGSIFPPFVTKDRRLEVYSGEVCSSVYLVYDKEEEYQGIPAYYFKTPKLEKSPDCLCPDFNGHLHEKCYAGVLRLYNCKNGAPVVMTKPHFLDAPKELLDGVVGMKPDRSIHNTTLIIQPTSGAVLWATKRIQIGVEYQTLEGITGFEDVNYTIIPVMWIEESGGLEEDSLAEFRFLLVTTMQILNVAQWVILGGLTILLVVGIILTFKNRGGKIIEPVKQ